MTLSNQVDFSTTIPLMLVPAIGATRRNRPKGGVEERDKKCEKNSRSDKVSCHNEKWALTNFSIEPKKIKNKERHEIIQTEPNMFNTNYLIKFISLKAKYA